ncbi:MAG TPA: hypothetical protein PKK68_02575 [Methanothrix soehngenii]|nr:hypothetical protein [Methanothrix soehngenii]
MAAAVTSSFVGSPAWDYLLQQSPEKLAQHILIQRDIIRDLRAMPMSDSHEMEALQLEIDSSHAQILALEEDLTEARDTIRRLVEGECVEWEVDA